MTASIAVTRQAGSEPLHFAVVVKQGQGESRHQVTMSQALCDRLTQGGRTPEACIEAAFRFLLDREAKESILARFDVSVIARYFPEFEGELRRYLERK